MRDRGEKRLYVVVAGTVQVPASTAPGRGERTVVQPWGRQAAQACHVVSKVRIKTYNGTESFEPITTIILQARDSAELRHIATLFHKKKIIYSTFLDSNPDYGPGFALTALSTWPIYKDQIVGVCDYLPLWSPK